MEIEQIIGNSIIGIEKRTSKASNTYTYSATAFPIMIDVTTGIGWNYFEVSLSIVPLIQISINSLLHE